MGWEQTASGYAAVWATENTREALFDAMHRKEVYATTGPRMVVRFFGGWDFQAGDAATRNPAVVGYAKGVPMGGDFERTGGQVANLPRGGLEGSDRRKPRSHPDHQGLAGREERNARKDLRGGLAGGRKT